MGAAVTFEPGRAPVILGMSRAVLVLSAIAWAVAEAFLALRGASPVGELGFLELGWTEAHTRLFEVAFAGTLAFSAAVLLLPRFVVGRLPGRIVLVTLALGAFALAAARTALGGAPFSEWTLLAESVRFAVPVALFSIGLGSARAWDRAAWTLRVAIALTFATHGCEALAHTPRFVDLVLIADQHLSTYIGGRHLFDQASTLSLLTGIGTVDLVLAFAVLVMRSRVLLTYMAFWGFVTAGARLLVGGPDWWPMALERAGNGGAPLALAFLMVAIRRSRSRTDSP